MSGMILRLQEITMGAMDCACAPCCEMCLPLREEPTTECRPLRANWSMVTDENGNRQLRMHWRAERDEAERLDVLEKTV